MPDFMFRRIPGIAGWIVTVEVVVSKEGVPRQPLLAQVGGLPVHLLFAFHSLGAWRFEPAQVDGEPVESIYTLTISNRRG